MLLLFFKEHPSHSALCCDISVELSPFAVKSMFWLRSGPITLQEITYPDLVVARTEGGRGGGRKARKRGKGKGAPAIRVGVLYSAHHFLN